MGKAQLQFGAAMIPGRKTSGVLRKKGRITRLIPAFKKRRGTITKKKESEKGCAPSIGKIGEHSLQETEGESYGPHGVSPEHSTEERKVWTETIYKKGRRAHRIALADIS